MALGTFKCISVTIFTGMIFESIWRIEIDQRNFCTYWKVENLAGIWMSTHLLGFYLDLLTRITKPLYISLKLWAAEGRFLFFGFDFGLECRDVKQSMYKCEHMGDTFVVWYKMSWSLLAISCEYHFDLNKCAILRYSEELTS